jgi:hypothetical protein
MKIRQTHSTQQQQVDQIQSAQEPQNTTPQSIPQQSASQEGGIAPLDRKDIGRRVSEHRVEGQARHAPPEVLEALASDESPEFSQLALAALNQTN